MLLALSAFAVRTNSKIRALSKTSMGEIDPTGQEGYADAGDAKEYDIASDVKGEGIGEGTNQADKKENEAASADKEEGVGESTNLADAKEYEFASA